MFKFVHAADLHLDSALRGLERYEGAPVARVRNASREAFENLVRLCIDEEAQFLLLAGDIFDDDWRDYGTGLFFAGQLSLLGKERIPVYLLYGNHDAGCQFTKQLKLPDNVHVFAHDRAHTFELTEHGVAIHGQSYDRRDVTRDLSQGYPKPIPGAYNIGVLHTAAEGRVGHQSYAPCTVAALAGIGYDYWALGHVHQYEVLRKAPWIVFPGNLQGRHAKELGPKGAVLVSVDDARATTVDPRTLDVVRWQHLQIDATGTANADDLRELCRRRFADALDGGEGRLVALRVSITGLAQAHAEVTTDQHRWTQQLRADATDIASDNLWIEKIKLQARAHVDLEALIQKDDPLGGLLRAFRSLRDDEPGLRALTSELTADLSKKLPKALLEGDSAIDLESLESLRELLDASEALLVAHLAAAGGEV